MKTTEEMAVGFYMWMQQNGYDHNIKQRVEGKFEEYHQSELLKLNKSDVSSRSLMSEFWSKSADLIDNYRESNDERAAQGVISCRILINRIMTDIDNDR